MKGKRVRFIGRKYVAQVWKNKSDFNHIPIHTNAIFKIGKWKGMRDVDVLSVLTNKDEWICDIDSIDFKLNFIYID